MTVAKQGGADGTFCVKLTCAEEAVGFAILHMTGA